MTLLHGGRHDQCSIRPNAPWLPGFVWTDQGRENAHSFMNFDWHADPITRSTVVDKNYKNTQNVRRFLTQECGQGFKFDRHFMAWIRSGAAKTMGDVADEWLRRRAS